MTRPKTASTPNKPYWQPYSAAPELDKQAARRYICISDVASVPHPSNNQVQQELSSAQQELYDWLSEYIGSNRHSPSIRQMMEAMGLRSPAPIQSRLRHLQQKGWITWQEGQARTLQLLGGMASGIPVLGAVAAGGLVETFDDIQERLDLAPVL
ncbi:MAG: hypothetical protein RLZZ213_940, partial [Cyanobacteriota bacterium]